MGKFVVADDSYAALQLMKDFSEGGGHPVVSRANGEKLEKKRVIERSDALVLDEC